MAGYTLYQVILLFFIYSFLGWCCEVAFAAVKTGKFVNRGFLNGPICPIYGFGVLAVIFALEPVSGSLPLLFICSVAVTTLLEYVTGLVLESVFHMKWWDYSQSKFNIGGYVCLEFSLVWGFAAVFVVKLIHPGIARLALAVPKIPAVILACIFTVSALADLACTVAAIGKLRKRLSLITSLGADMRELSDKLADAISGTVIRTVDAAVETKSMYSELFEMMENHRAEEKALAEKNRAQEQELFESIRNVNKSRKQRYDELRRRRLDAIRAKGLIQRRIMKAFPSMHVYGYEEAARELRKFAEELDQGKKHNLDGGKKNEKTGDSRN